MSPDNETQNQTEPPKGVVHRLSLYLRELRKLAADSKVRISSTRLGELLDLNPAQVRKDLSYLGQIGLPGVGYRCVDLIERIQQTLGTHRTWPVALFGCGKIGQALLSYGGFDSQGFHIVAAFDADFEVIGTVHGGIRVESISDAAASIERLGIRLAIIAVPAEQAQATADQLVTAGIQGILNFAPVVLVLPKSVSVVAVDLAIGLEQLAFGVVRQLEND
ncbi:MAG TPA: redox-sensing transcriptional repressor Rex [Pirellulaceae bacterium]|nr:redox-sensing transcriptional repressor Rex [Pirellulaceae bacterium]